MRLIDPLPGRYDSSDPYGSTRGRPYPHTGSDWPAPEGTPAVAIGAGRVVNKQWDAGNGNTVTVLLPDGHYYAYLHLLSAASVAVGQQVSLGQTIGSVGNTGTNSHGSHLHITVSDSPSAYVGGGRTIDPWAFIQAHINDSDTPAAAAFEGEEQDVYIRRIATGEIAVFGADYRSATGGSTGRHHFATSAEYDAWRSVLTTYNAQIDAQGLDPRGKKFVPPAAMTNIMGVDEAGWAVICGLYGV
jgi:hypothetical protein